MASRETVEKVESQRGQYGGSAVGVARIAMKDLVVRRREAEVLETVSQQVAGFAQEVVREAGWKEPGSFRNEPYVYEGTDWLSLEDGRTIALREDSHISHSRGEITIALFQKADERVESVAEFVGGNKIDMSGVGPATLAEVGQLETLLIWIVQNTKNEP